MGQPLLDVRRFPVPDTKWWSFVHYRDGMNVGVAVLKSPNSGVISLRSVVSLGKFREEGLRDVCEHEANDFTPWLVKNAEMLGETRSLGVEFTLSEQHVGPLAVDNIGRDLTHNAALIVENHLKKTNHAHLGQLISYSANTDAVTDVWVGGEFTDEYRQATDYLNEPVGNSGFENAPGYGAVLGWIYSLGLIVLVSLIQFYWLKEKKDL